MVIKKLVKKNNESVEVCLDSGENIVLSLTAVVQLGLRKGTDLTEEDFLRLKDENEKFLISNAAMRFLTLRDHSAFETRVKLERKGFRKNLIAEVINNLINQRFINDEEFALRYANEMSDNKKWGINKVRGMLYQKGIKREIIEDVIKKINEEEGNNENIFFLAEKKLKSLSGKSIEKRALEQKLIAFLISRGYPFDQARETVRKVTSDVPETDSDS